MIDIDAPISPAQTIAYATPAHHSGPRLSAAVWITIAGLALIVLGGCFLIGVMEMTSSHFNFGLAPQPATMSPSVFFFIAVLYVMAFSCFGGAFAILVKGLHLLFKFATGI